MNRFKCYLLQEKGLSQASTKSYAYSLSKLQCWLMQEGLTADQLNYRHLLGYVKQRLLRGESKRYVNHSLTAIRHYYDYLIHQGLSDYNPATNLHVRGQVRRLPHGLLEREELDVLYRSFGGNLQDKVLVGLLVFQGLTLTELLLLEPGHVNVQHRQLHVPTTNRSNGRVLALAECQLELLVQLLEKAGTGSLFVSGQSSSYLANKMSLLMDRLRRINPSVRHASQLRMSVICSWLKKKDVRLVQHMAGHRHVSSTERYRLDRLHALQQEVASFHPLL
jgi:integrase/recombinase XerD